MFRKLRIRLTVVCTIATGLVLIGMTLATLRFAENQYHQQTSEAFTSNMNTVFYYLRGQAVIDHSWLAQTEAESGLLMRIEDNGRPLVHTTANPERERLTSLVKQLALVQYDFDTSKAPRTSILPESVVFTAEVDGVEYRAAVCKVPTQAGWMSVVILKETTAERAQILKMRVAYTAFVIGAIVCLTFVAGLFTGWAIRPVKESRRKQAEFISAASHELRSPLAVMQASAGAMRDAPPEKAQTFARTIEGECVRLSGLTEDLLALAGAEGQRWTIQYEQVDMMTLLLSVSERYEVVAAGKGLRIQVDLPDDVLPRCRCDKKRIDQLLSVLVDNAISYTPSGGRIRIAAERKGKRMQVTVADSGSGIPDGQKERVFERFYRADKSRSKKEHYGLGLSIAQEIAQLHRGKLWVEDAPEGGAAFVLSLPL